MKTSDTQQSLLSAILVATGIALSALPGAHAATINATAETEVNAVVTTVVDNGPGSAFAQAFDPGGEADATAASDDSGRLATSAAFFGANGTQARNTASASWSETFVAGAGANAQFNFFIPGGAIGFEANNVGPLSGGYSVVIEFNGAQVFVATGDVVTTANTPETAADVSLTQTGTIIGSSFDTGIARDFFGSPGAGYRFEPFAGSLDLVTVGGDNTISYTMTVFVAGLIGETSALASIGDPLDLSVNPGIELQIDTPPGPQQVGIDIRPRSKKNPVNLKSNGVISVAVLGSADFDATQIDRETVAFGPGGAAAVDHRLRLRDVNRDGFLDQVFRFRVAQTGLSCDDVEATLTATTFDGTAIAGSDAVRVRGCKPNRKDDDDDDDDD